MLDPSPCHVQLWLHVRASVAFSKGALRLMALGLVARSPGGLTFWEGQLGASRLRAWERSPAHSANPISWSETPPYSSSHNNLHRFFIGTTYLHLKNKIMNFKNKGYFKFSHQDAHFIQKRWGGTESTPPNSYQMECSRISFTISILCYTAVRDFTRNKFTTQMASEGFKEELTKLS